MKTSTVEFRERVTALGAADGERTFSLRASAHRRDVSDGDKPDGNASGEELTADVDLKKMQRETFNYFVNELKHAKSFVLDKDALNGPASITAKLQAQSNGVVTKPFELKTPKEP